MDELLRQPSLKVPEPCRQTPISNSAAAAAVPDDVVEVLVLEARTLCSAATGRNGGHLQPLIHAAPAEIIDFEMRNFRHVERVIKRGAVNCDFRRVEGCLGFWNEQFFEEAKKGLAEMAGKSVDGGSDPLVRVVQRPDELARLGLRGGVKGAIVQSLAASLSPYKLVVRMWERLLEDFEVSVAQGKGRLNLQTETPVLSMAPDPDASDDHDDGGWLLQTPRGTVHAQTVILATNAYTSHLVPSPFSRLIVPVQAQMSALLPPVHSKYRRSLIPMSYGFMGVNDMDREMSDYLVQTPVLLGESAAEEVQGGGGHLMFGGGRQNALTHGVGVWHDDFVDARVERYLRGLGQRLDLDLDHDRDQGDVTRTTMTTTLEHRRETTNVDSPLLDIVASWTGIMGSSADGHPWVGAVPGLQSGGLFVCAGYSGHGMTNAPLCGRYVARLAAKRRQQQQQQQLQMQGAALRKPLASEGVRDQESECMDADVDVDVPKQYLITRERIERALDAVRV